MRHFFQHSLILCLAGILCCMPMAHAEEGNAEYSVKAAFIYNFIKSIEWPDGKAVSKQSNIDICVLGNSPLMGTGNVFKQASSKPGNPKFSLIQEKSWKNAPEHCHVLFIGGSAENSLEEILSGLKGQPVLTISDMDSFAEHGGMIGFVLRDNKVRMEINSGAAATAGLRIQADLLGLALNVIR